MKSKLSPLFLLVVLLCGLPLAAPGQEEAPGWGLEQLMADLRAQAGPENRVAYQEEKHYAFLEQELESSGILSFSPPDTLIREVLAPDPGRYTIEGQRLLIEEEGAPRRELHLGDYPQAAVFIEAFRAALTGDLAKLQHHFRIELSGRVSRWHLRLVPLDAEIVRVVESIVLTGRRGRVKEIRTNEAGGDFTLMLLSPEAGE
jgi:hypothetical protein